MKKLKARRDRLARRIARNQKWRKRLGLTREQMAEHGQKGLAKRLRKRIMVQLTERIKELHVDLKAVEAKIDKLHARGDDGRKAFLKFLESNVGLTENDPKRVAMARDVGADPSWPWCSVFLAYGLKHHGGFDGKLPANPAYSGAWLTWPYGERVSYSQSQPGDLLIFDWGDGGMTDHIATYVGGGLKIGGNENDRVEKDAVPTSNVVGVVRPEWS